MPWIKEIPVPHQCQLPSAVVRGNGSVWQCNTCEKMWILHGWVWRAAYLHDDGQYYPYWQIKTESTKKKKRWFASK